MQVGQKCNIEDMRRAKNTPPNRLNPIILVPNPYAALQGALLSMPVDAMLFKFQEGIETSAVFFHRTF